MHTATFQPLIKEKKNNYGKHRTDIQVPEWYQPKTGATNFNKSRF